MIFVDKDLLKSVFGPPDRVSSYGHNVTWTYPCSDGTIYLRFTQIPYGGGALFESLDES